MRDSDISKEFSDNRRRFLEAIRRILQDGSNDQLDEAAFPAYAHRNWFVNKLFWHRLFTVQKFLAEKTGGVAVDFGCGSGVMLPFLSKRFDKVIAIDIDLEPVNAIKKFIDFPSNIEFVDMTKVRTLRELIKLTDCIIALDVLEHVEDLSSVLNEFVDISSEQLVLIASLPTENFLYKLGRSVAGKQFTGSYHVSNAKKVSIQLLKQFSLKNLAHFPFNLFFNISYCIKK